MAGRAGHRVKVTPHSLSHQVIALVAGVRPVLTKVGDGNQDQAGVGLGQPFIAQSQFRQPPRWIALNDNIRSGSQSLEKLPTVGLLHVQRDAPLVGIEGKVGGAPVGIGNLVNKGRLVAGLVAPAGRLNLDGVRALVGQQLGAISARGPVGQFQYAQFRKYSGHGLSNDCLSTNIRTIAYERF